jgi:hypothetical protein
MRKALVVVGRVSFVYSIGAYVSNYECIESVHVEALVC